MRAKKNHPINVALCLDSKSKTTLVDKRHWDVRREFHSVQLGLIRFKSKHLFNTSMASQIGKKPPVRTERKKKIKKTSVNNFWISI